MNASALATTPEVGEDDLKKIDFIIVIDHSGSMANESKRFPGRTRILEVQEDVIAIARLAQNYDDDGITAIGFSSNVNVKDGVTADAVANIFREFQPRGSTNLAAALEAAIKKVESSAKEGVVIVYTDGEPDSQPAVVDVIKRAATKLGRPKIGFALVQVGDDTGAAKFLDMLDNNLKGVPDCVASIKAKDAETLSIGQITYLARNS